MRLTPRVFHNRHIRMLVPPDLARLAPIRAVMDFIVELFARDADLFSGERAAAAWRAST